MNDLAPSINLTSHSPDDTAQWAIALAPIAQAGRVICLSGDMGTGKTFFARSLIQTLQTTPEDVPSPTFTLVQTYDAGDLEIWHADLYRLSGPSEVDELGLLGAFDTAFCLIEWPDRLGELIPKNALHMAFSHSDRLEDRYCKITSSNATLLDECAQHLKKFAHA
jgi:tRNA threonylcarbamoyladenosine biosynthesis protein TsaE